MHAPKRASVRVWAQDLIVWCTSSIDEEQLIDAACLHKTNDQSAFSKLQRALTDELKHDLKFPANSVLVYW
jgi:hypothetical protein